jgi:hypothetical protein
MEMDEETIATFEYVVPNDYNSEGSSSEPFTTQPDVQL